MPDDSKVYGDFTQAELDWQYNNRERVPTNPEILAGYAERGEAFIKDAPHTFDIPFGDTAAEVLDVYPATGGGDGSAPVMIYFHGGYWFSRHKDDFRFIPAGFTPAGAMVVVVNYALIPEVDMAELVRQCRASVAWTHKNAADHGGDPGADPPELHEPDAGVHRSNGPRLQPDAFGPTVDCAHSVCRRRR